MNTQLATTTSYEVGQPIDDTLLIQYLDAMGLGAKLNTAEKNQFLQISKAYQLNPFKREIYATKYEGGADSFSIIVGYETYIKRAERTGKLDGWEVDFQGEGENLTCTITIYRKDWTRPFKHQVFYSESVQKTKDGRVTKFWQKARTMTRKVAISQGFRLAFPDELGGMPYTADEMPEREPVQETTYAVVADPIPPAKTPDEVVREFVDLIDGVSTLEEIKGVAEKMRKAKLGPELGPQLGNMLVLKAFTLGFELADSDQLDAKGKPVKVWQEIPQTVTAE